MSSTQKRKLAAILFADIVGYTALMQKDEQTASQLLRNFQQQLEEKVNTFNGQIVNFYGDGALCTFQIPIDALRCAMALQTTFKESPETPVRIGIHSGTVTVEGDKIFGDSVNITSRIESMGIPGGILLSKKIRDEVKNNPDLKMTSLGSFEFKNVEEPMEVFALANEGYVVPNPAQLQGKFKATTNSKKLMPLLSAAIVSLLLLGGIGWYWQQDQLPSATFNKEILQDRIAVLPFQNQTNNPELDILGAMASDWITRGLMSIEQAEVVSPNTVRQHLDAVGILPNHPEGEAAFSDLTGAQTILQGNYYQEKEEVLFNLEITDAISGQLLYSFTPIRGAVSQKEKTIEGLQEKVTGFWAVKEEVLQKKFKAPKYEAYKLFLESSQEMWFEANAFQSFLKILELDSNFYFARLEFIHNNQDAIVLSNLPHLAFLERHKEQLSFYERKYYGYVQGQFEGNYLVAQNNIDELRKKYPKDLAINAAAGMNALTRLRNPQLALNILETIDIQNYHPDKDGRYYFGWVHNYFDALYRLNRFQDAAEYFETLPQAYKSNIHGFPIPYFFSLIRLGKEEQVLKLLEKRAKNPQVELNAFGVSAGLFARHFLVLNQPENMKKVTNIISTTIQQNRQKIPFAPLFEFSILGLTQQWEQIANFPYEQLSSIPYYDFILNSKGIAYIKTGQPEKVQLIFQQLEEYYEKNQNNQADINARTVYTKAVLYAQLGDQEKAVQYLKVAFEEGMVSDLVPFEFDPYLKPLEGYAPYEELLKPIEVPFAE